MTGIGQKGFKIALLKLPKGFNKAENVRIAMSEIHRAKKNGAQLIVLPECFNSPYGTDYFEDYAEEVPSGSTCRALARTAAEANVCVVGGTVPEKYGNKVYNTCTVWSNRGKLLAIHRQMHFIQINTPNALNLNKTNVLSTGDEITTFEYGGTKIGIGISHDLFFPELAHLMSKQGCSLLVYLGAFGKIMGVEPTQVFARSRAGDEQLWVALASSADACLMLVDPRATVVARTERQILIADIDLNLVEEVRRQISIRAQKIDGYTVHVKACCKFPVSTLKVALVQLSVGPDKAKNLAAAVNEIHKAKEKGAQLVALPECFNSPYGTKYFEEYAEEVPSGVTSRTLSQAAAEAGVCVVGGTLPERRGAALYNTCTVWGGRGELLATHRKMHLFDIDIQNKITFKESEVLSAGDQITTFDYQGIKIGIGICYDLRFSEMAHLMAKQGCSLLIYPGAFNMTTGPKHWELLARARANDEQLWVALVSPARDTSAGYVAWGHSLLVDPWATVVDQLSEGPGTLVADVDLNVVEEVRSQIPIRVQRRTDIYDTIQKK